MSAPTLPGLRPVTLRLRGRDDSAATITVLGEPTANEHLAITPGLSEDGYTGSFVLAHAPTGRTVCAGRPGELRDIAGRVAHLDWSSTDADALIKVVGEETRAAIRAVRFTEPSGVELPAHDAWGKDGKGKGLPRLAVPMIQRFLADFQRSWNRTGGDGPDRIPIDIPDPDNPGETKPNPEWSWHLMREVHDYGLTYLLAALQRIDPEVADSAAAALADAWEYGDSLGEWAYQWAEELAAGKPLTLHGIPGPAGEILGEAR